MNHPRKCPLDNYYIFGRCAIHVPALPPIWPPRFNIFLSDRTGKISAAPPSSSMEHWQLRHIRPLSAPDSVFEIRTLHTHTQTDMCVQTLKKSGDWEYHIYEQQHMLSELYKERCSNQRVFHRRIWDGGGRSNFRKESCTRVIFQQMFPPCVTEKAVFYFFFFVTDSDSLSPGFSLKITQYNLLLEISFLG